MKKKLLAVAFAAATLAGCSGNATRNDAIERGIIAGKALGTTCAQILHNLRVSAKDGGYNLSKEERELLRSGSLLGCQNIVKVVEQDAQDLDQGKVKP